MSERAPVPVVGITAIDANNLWVGGRYYLHHLIRAVASLPDAERVPLVDVWWQSPPHEFDPFAEVRPLLDGQRVITQPRGPARVVRSIRRAIHGWRDARDLFHDAGIDALFPIAPCADPGIPLIAWLPDFQYARMPELFTDDLRTRFERNARDNAREATLVVVSSEDGRRDVAQFIPEAASKCRVLHFCSIPTSEWWSLGPAAAQERAGLPERFFVLSNQFSAQKNHTVVFEAVRILRDRGVPVTVVCTGSTYGFHGDSYFAALRSFLEEQRLEDSIRILGLLDRDLQIALMRRSIAMLQPSRFEGWSTVVEDSKALGKHLLVSDIAVHREQAPENAVFLPIDDAGVWADAMEQAWSDCGPGPDSAAEERGSEYVIRAARAFGATFAGIAREAVRTP